MLQYSEPTPLDVAELTAELRPDDAREIWEMTRRDPAAVIRYSVEVSDVCSTVRDENGLVCIIGAHVPVAMGGLVAPWMLGTRRVADHKISLIKHSKAFLAHLLHHFDRAENVVWEGHMASIIYLEAVGFKLGKRQETLHGAGYYRFWKDRGDV